MIELTLKIGKRMQIKVTGDDEAEIIRRAAFFEAWPDQCPECQADLKITYRHPGNYEYHGLECTGPLHHEFTFGVKMDKTGLFYDESKPWKVWEGRREPDNYDEQPEGRPMQGRGSAPPQQQAQPPARNYTKPGETPLRNVRHANECAVCNTLIDDAVIAFSQQRFGKPLCRTCQNAQAKPAATGGGYRQ